MFELSRLFPRVTLVALLFLATGCEPEGASSPVGEPAGATPGSRPVASAPPETRAERPWFVERTRELGITHVHSSGRPERLLIIESLGSGVAIFDADGDGRQDLYFNNAGSLRVSEKKLELLPGPGNRLYLQEPGGGFVDRTREAGLTLAHWGTGVAVGDIDGDGDPDLLVCALGPDRLYENRGEGRFVDITEKSGLAADDASLSSSAVFLDHDRDGDLDLYVVKYVEFDPEAPPRGGEPCRQNGIPISCSPTLHHPAQDRLWRNRGDGTFEDVTVAAGLTGVPGGYGLGVVAGDLDGDDHVDLYVANDTTANFQWRNRGDGTFEEVALFSGTALGENAQGQSGMGVDLADLDGDGALDLHVTNYAEEPNALYRNLGDGTFDDLSAASGLARHSFPHLGWGLRLVDLDFDGHRDLVVANGHVHPNSPRLGHGSPFEQPLQLFRGGAGGRLELLADRLTGSLARPGAHRALASGDLDDDGDVDLVVTVLDGPPRIFINETARGNSIAFRLAGKTSSRHGIGATIRIRAGDFTSSHAVTRGGSYLSSNEIPVRFGLADRAGIDSGEVRWPSGVKTTLGPLEAGRVYRVEEIDGPVEPAVLER